MWKRWYCFIGFLLLTGSIVHAQLVGLQGATESSSDPLGLISSPAGESEIDLDWLPSARAEHAGWLTAADVPTSDLQPIAQVAAVEFSPSLTPLDRSGIQATGARAFSGEFTSHSKGLGVGVNWYAAPEFANGLIVVGKDVAMKIGGYAKADFIYDFDPIDSTDSFVTTSIPVDAPERTNFRAHARQTRLSFDTRWKTDGCVVQVFVEGDFFSEGNQFRLRHAYGEVGSLLVGRTWTTFTDVGAAPATIDFEGSVSNVNRRQAQVRWTKVIINDVLTFAVALEDTQFIVIPPPSISGSPRSPSPDFIARLRLKRDWGQFQTACLFRRGGFQTDAGTRLESNAWGLNFTGTILLVESTKAYYQILFGEGIGSYRGLPDAAPVSPTTGEILPLFGWMVGVTHQWNEQLSSNFTYAQNQLENAPLQVADDVSETTYLAANLVWSPLERVKVGIEYLYGVRQNVDLSKAEAHRIQTAIAFILP